ncbi:hypothetical protein BJV82DRAFT_211312 [Fennellomyces sp. T-0311]|nr:hypothetical protein BJV82DRAFT_211312 [Fennellomyces sp. T-0311]
MFNYRWFLDTKLIDDLEANKATLPSGSDMPISGAINDTVPGMSLLQKGSCILLQLEDLLHSGTDQERLQLINSLQSLIPTSGAPTIELKHPLPVLSSKGRPSTKRNKSAFELHEERGNKKAKQWNKLDPATKWPFLSSDLPTNKVTNVFSPVGDGHCGFRCLAHVLKPSGQSAFGDIKDEMMEYLVSKQDWYLESGVFIMDDIRRLRNILNAKGNCVDDPGLWFSSPDCTQLASDTFRIPIEVYTPLGNTLFLPFTNTRYAKYKPIVLQLHSSHFYGVTVKGKYSHPRIYCIYESICRNFNINNQSHQFMDISVLSASQPKVDDVSVVTPKPLRIKLTAKEPSTEN